MKTGILKQAGNAKENSIVGQEKEEITLAYVSATANKFGDTVSPKDLQTELDQIAGNGKTEVWLDEDGSIIYVHFYDTDHYYNLENGLVFEIDSKNIAPEGMVARIGDNYYETLQSAVDTVVADNTETEVVLLKNVSENVIIGENQNIVLDLNRKTITNADNTATINVEGSLDIQNGTIIGNYSEEVASICVGENAIVNLSNTTVDRNSDEECNWETIELHGEVRVDSGKISSTNNNAICGYGGAMLEISGTAEISGTGNYPTISLYDGDIANISGGRITAESDDAIYNDGGTISISEGNIEGIYNGGTLTILGGIVSGSIYVYNGICTIGSKDSEFNTSNPVIQGDYYGISIHGGDLFNFYNGILKSNKDMGYHEGPYDCKEEKINVREGYEIYVYYDEEEDVYCGILQETT